MASSSKIVVTASAAVALIAQAWLGAREWQALMPMTLAALVAGYVLMRIAPPWGWAPFLLTAYVYPAIFHATRDFFTFSYYSIGFAALLGMTAAAAPVREWHLPRGWRLPLAFWALALALCWPLLALRELNFHPELMGAYTNANSRLGGPPQVIIVTMLAAITPQIIGILWFDAMFGRFPEGRLREFRLSILMPLAISLTLGSGLAAYQWAVDFTFLSGHQWPSIRRAAGGLYDGNASGALSGIWSAAALSWGLAGGWIQILAGVFVAAITWLAVWGSGSRMALLAALVGLATLGYAVVRGSRRRSLIAAVSAAAIAAGGLALVLDPPELWRMNPVTRTIDSLPTPDRAAVKRFIEFEFWNRFGPFGTASVRMVKDSPIVGVGPGTFEVLYPDYAYRVTGGRARLHFDNAQSWYRHQLAELGFLGSLGWIVWGTAFALFLWRAAPARDGLTEATGVKGAMVGLAIISLVSMPNRNPFVSISFWVFAFWLVKLSPEVDRPRWLARFADRRAGWAAVWLLAIGFTALTAWVGYTQLRPPHRALMADWDYLSGVSRPVETEDGVVRYAGEHGVAVFYAVPGAYLKLAFQLAHDDAASSPVHVQILHGDTQVAHFVIADRGWREIYIKVPEGQPDRMLLQTIVDRPATNGSVPARGLILKDWEFVANPPHGAMVATAAR